MNTALRSGLFTLGTVLCLLSACHRAKKPADTVALPAQEYEQTVVAICRSAPRPENVLGSGFLVSPAGVVITADHVIRDSTGRTLPELLFVRQDPRRLQVVPVDVVRRFTDETPSRDIALLRPKESVGLAPLPFLPIVDRVQVGTEVLIAGFPLVFTKTVFWPFFRKGIVATTRLSLENTPVLLLDLTMVPGFSGSPVVSLMSGRAVGVMVGSSSNNSESDFSVAELLQAGDSDTVFAAVSGDSLGHVR